MQTTIKLAWKNIWRSRIRSLVVIASIIVGVWAVIFLMSFSLGMGDSYVKNAIKNQFSHLQAHHPGFMDDQLVKYTLPYDSSLIAQIPEVKILQHDYWPMGCSVRGMEPGGDHKRHSSGSGKCALWYSGKNRRGAVYFGCRSQGTVGLRKTYSKV